MLTTVLKAADKRETKNALIDDARQRQEEKRKARQAARAQRTVSEEQAERTVGYAEKAAAKMAKVEVQRAKLPPRK